MATPTPLQDQLIALEKSLAGFHPTHYIRQSLIDQIEILRPKAEAEKGYLADPSDPRNPEATSNAMKQRLSALHKTLAGFGAGHYIVPEIKDNIRILEAQITQKKTRN